MRLISFVGKHKERFLIFKRAGSHFVKSQTEKNALLTPSQQLKAFNFLICSIQSVS